MTPKTLNTFIKIFMRVLISLLVLFVGVYIILSDNYTDDVQKWSYGAVGTVIGYWIK